MASFMDSNTAEVVEVLVVLGVLHSRPLLPDTTTTGSLHLVVVVEVVVGLLATHHQLVL